MASYGLWQGLEKATGQMAQTGMRLMEFRVQREHQQAVEALERDRYTIAKEQAGREKTAFEYAERKRVEQETIENAIVPASLVRPKFHTYPRMKEQYVEIMENAGFKLTKTPDEVYGSNKAFAYLRQVLQTKHEAILETSQAGLVDLQDQSNAIGEQILQLQQSGKDDEKTVGQLQKLQKQQLDIKTQIGVVIGGREKVMEAIASAQAKPVQQDTVPYMTKEGKTVLINERDPRSQVIIDQQGLIPATTIKTPVETWGPEVPGPGGTTQQTSSRGQVRQIYKPPAVEKPEKLTMTDVKSAYSMDIGNIKNQMMIEMTPDEQINLAGQPDINILALLLAGRIGKSLSPEKKKYYIGNLQEVEKYYGDLTNQVLGRKGAKVPQPEKGKIGVPELAPSHRVKKEGLIEVPGGFRYIRPKK